jgi:hypothetical protein
MSPYMATTLHTFVLSDGFSNKLSGCPFLSFLNLVKGYHQVPIAAKDITKTVIVTPFGLFKYLYMPFGLKKGPRHFSCSWMGFFITCHSSSCLWTIISPLFALWRHLNHLFQFFALLEKNGLKINLAKRNFVVAEVNFLGYRVDSSSIRRSSPFHHRET